MKIINNTSKRYWFSLSTVLLLAIGTPAAAECPDVSTAKPAQLIQSEVQDELIAEFVKKWKSKELIKKIDVPYSKEEKTELFYSGTVEKSGFPNFKRCFRERDGKIYGK